MASNRNKIGKRRLKNLLLTEKLERRQTAKTDTAKAKSNMSK